jgi:hypothetical protein
MSWLKFESRTSRIQARSIAATPICSAAHYVPFPEPQTYFGGECIGVRNNVNTRLHGGSTDTSAWICELSSAIHRSVAQRKPFLVQLHHRRQDICLVECKKVTLERSLLVKQRNRLVTALRKTQGAVVFLVGPQSRRLPALVWSRPDKIATSSRNYISGALSLRRQSLASCW